MKSLLKRILVIVCSMLTISFSMTAVFSDFSHSASSSASSTISAKKSEKVACAYIGSGNKSKLYTIEDALKVAAADSAPNTVFVIPGSVATITEDCTIAEGDSLVLPYEDETFLARDINATSFADQNASNVAKYRKSNISIAQNVTLTNNGTLTIGGQLGGDGSPNLQGITCGYYSQITMNSASQIISYGNINVYGYIKQSSSKFDDANVELMNNSSIKAPMVIYDFKGGSFTLNMIERKSSLSTSVVGGVFPMSEFDFPNLQCWTKVNYGAKYTGMVDLYANSQHNTMDCELFGVSSGLFRLSSGYVSVKYQPNSWNGVESYTSDNRTAGTTKIKINGTCSLSSISITVSMKVVFTINLKIDSSKFFLPLSYKFDIEVCTGAQLILDYDVKLMTGSKIVIDEGGMITANASFSAYTEFKDAAGTNARYLSYDPTNFIVNGVLTLNSNKSYGGIIKSQREGVQLKTGSNVNVTTLEMNGNSRVNHSESLQGYNSSGSLFVLSPNKTYTSKLSSDGAFYYWE